MANEKEATVETSRILRMVVATAVVSALAVLFTTPANALLRSEGGGGYTVTAIVGNPGDGALADHKQVVPIQAGQLANEAPTVGNPGDGSSIPTQVVGNRGDFVPFTPVEGDQPTVSTGGDEFDRGMLFAIAGSVVLALGAGALLVMVRHRRVALP
jgi:hypothetical protein